MSREFYLEYKIHFETERCGTCHRWWAKERYSSHESTCPYCKSTYHARLVYEQAQLRNKVTSLKGQLTRLRKKYEDQGSSRK